MEKAAEGFLSKIGDFLAEATIRQCRYLCCFNNIVKDLQEEETNLTLAKERMEGRVRRARNNTEIIEKDVKKWQSDSSNILEEVAGLRSEIEEKKSCLRGWCPNCCCRYWLGRKAAKKTIIMKRLVENCKIENVGRLASLPDDLEFLPPKDFEFFPSSKSVFEQIVEALKNVQINLVGLHGMGGTGKTTLARAVGENVRGKTFDKVITVTVSQTPDFEGIQARLAHSLGVQLQEKTEEDRAKRLFKRFMGTDTETDKKQEAEKILVILDDVWESFDLRAKLGISFEGDHKGCKVLLTTRLEQVCIDMNCQQRTQLNVLEEEEGLALLKKHAGIGDDSSLFNDEATQVAKECGGLPLALVAIGCSLKEKGINEWNVMSRNLQRSKLEDIPYSKVAGDKGIYATLKVSYDYLMGEKSKPCFLLCSLFPEDHAIPLEELLWYAMGLGWYQHADSIEEARSELLSTVGYLKASGLLLDAKVPSPLLYASAEHVKMHDMFRDVALWIASQGENVFMRKVGMGQIDWSKEEDWERYTAISLLANKIDELSVGLACPKLEILMLGGESSWKMLKVSDKYFEEMKGLKVLSLTYVDLSLKSLQFLKNLKTLQLVRCNTRDISYLEKLNRLEILLFYDPPDVLPREICELHNLRIVYLKKSVRIPSNVLGRCSQLEELYALDKSRNTGVEETSMAGIREVISLPRLRTLHFSIYAKCLPEDLAFPKLQRYVICLNTDSYMLSYKRALEISHVEAVSLIAFEALYETLEYLRLEEVTGCVQNILPSIDRRFNELKEACISDCDMLQEVFQLEGLYHARKEVLPMLAKLKLEDLQRLRYIWKGPTQCVNFQSLKNLYINSCRSLEYIFPISIARDLVRLEGLTIKNAPQVKQVFYVDHASEENIAEIDGKDIVLPKLRVITLDTLESLTSFVPENYHLTCPTLEELHILKCSRLTKTFSFGEKLKVLKIEYCPKLRHVFSCNLARNLLPLEELSIEDCEEMEYITVENNEEDHPQPLLFPNLRKITAKRCAKLKYLFPISINQHLQQLESIWVERCDQLENVFEHKNGADVMNDQEILLSQLKQLTLIQLPSITNFVPMGYHFISKLRVLEIDCCPKLRHVFSSSLARNLSELEELSIKDCEEMAFIIVENNEEDHPQPLFIPNLRKITVKWCGKLKYLFPTSIIQHLQQLESMRVERCNQLEKVFEHKDGADIMNDKEILLLQLKQLSLCGLPKLTNFGPMGYHFILKLQVLEIECCHNQLFNGLTLSYSRYEELIINNCGVKVVFQLDSFQTVIDRETKELSHPSLKMLILESLKELEDLVKDPKEILCLQNLTYLFVKNCPKLRHDFFSTLASNLLRLEKLFIEDCEEMKYIIVEDNKKDHSQPICFPNLREIALKRCGKLKYLFPISITQHLQQLESLKVESCDQLEKVFEQKDGADVKNNREFCLPQLKHLSLYDLQSLANFGPIGYHFILKLNSLRIIKCDKMCAGYHDCKGYVIFIYGLQPELKSLDEAESLSKDPTNILSSQYLFIVKCQRLKQIFSSNLSRDLLQLKELYIRNCEELEQIIVEDDEKDHMQTPFFPNLSRFEVGECNKLKHLFPVNIYVQSYDQFQRVSGHRNEADEMNGKEIVLPRLKILCIRNCKELEQIIVEDDKTDHIQTPFFPNLSRIYVSGCNKLKHLLLVNIAASLQQLESIYVQGCDQLQKIFGHKNGADDMHDKEIVLPQLKKLSFKALPNLTNFGPGDYHFRMKLYSFLMSGCDKMCARCLYPKGHVIVIYGLQREAEGLCKGLTNILSSQYLFSLCIVKCKLKQIFSSNLIRDLLQLKELYIINCEELEQLIVKDDEKDHVQTPFFPNLFRIEVSGCNKLKHLFPDSIATGLQQLESIYVQGCDRLQKLFEHKNEADAMNGKEFVLPQLKSLCISNCDELEQIIVEDDEKDHIRTPLFPNLRRIDVSGCNKLKHMFPVKIAEVLQQLESINVQGCGQLQKVFGHKNGANDMNVEEIVLPQLKTLSFKALPNLSNFSSMGYQFLMKLNSLSISGCDQMCAGNLCYEDPVIFIYGLQRELRSLEEAEGLCKLLIIKSYNLKYIFSSNLARDLLQLKELDIINCEELEHIIVEDDEKDHIHTPFFPNLSRIRVIGCNKLKHLFPANIAAHLQQLNSIYVEGCDQLQKVFGHKNGVDDMNDEEILLPQLETLSFKALPNLTNIDPVGYHFRMRILNSLIMEGCNDQLWKIYFEDFVGSFKVSEAYYVQDHVTVSFQRDGRCKFTISGVNKTDLRCVGDPLGLGLCRGLTLTFTLHNLYKLRINECHKMRHIFSPNLPRHLLNLSYLYISNCEELEQIIAEDARSPYVPNLLEIEICGCNKLKHVLRITMVRRLLKLKRIAVKECDQLEEVFVDEDDVMDDKDVVFSTLECLELEKLQRLTNFCSMGYHCIFPSLGSLIVKECPKTVTRFFRSEDRSLIVHAEGKPPKEGCSDDDQPTMDIICNGYLDFLEKLPLFMDDKTTSGSPSCDET